MLFNNKLIEDQNNKNKKKLFFKENINNKIQFIEKTLGKNNLKILKKNINIEKKNNNNIYKYNYNNIYNKENLFFNEDEEKNIMSTESVFNKKKNRSYNLNDFKFNFVVPTIYNDNFIKNDDNFEMQDLKSDFFFLRSTFQIFYKKKYKNQKILKKKKTKKTKK